MHSVQQSDVARGVQRGGAVRQIARQENHAYFGAEQRVCRLPHLDITIGKLLIRRNEAVASRNHAIWRAES